MVCLCSWLLLQRWHRWWSLSKEGNSTVNEKPGRDKHQSHLSKVSYWVSAMVSFSLFYQYQSDCQIQQPFQSGFNLCYLFIGWQCLRHSPPSLCPWSPEFLSLPLPVLDCFAGPSAPSAHLSGFLLTPCLQLLPVCQGPPPPAQTFLLSPPFATVPHLNSLKMLHQLIPSTPQHVPSILPPTSVLYPSWKCQASLTPSAHLITQSCHCHLPTISAFSKVFAHLTLDLSQWSPT